MAEDSDEGDTGSSSRDFVRVVMQELRRSCCCCCYHPPTTLTNTHNRFNRAPTIPEARVLVLGASDTGKSTFMKQMRYVFGDTYPVADRIQYHPHIRRNLLESVHKMVVAARTFNVTLATNHAQTAAERFLDMAPLENYLVENADMDPSLTEAVKVVWSDPRLQEVYQRGNEYHLMTNADHFVTSAARLLHQDYVPTVEDILKMRYATKSSVMSTYEFSEMKMTLQDMGGQRSERVRWVNQLQHRDPPAAILFLASLSEYDQCVEEEEDMHWENKNRVEESLGIFEDVLDFESFQNSPVILLLNKSDVFSKKITVHPLAQYFPEYTGTEGDELAGREFLAKLYENLALKHGRHFVVRFTEATNTENFKAIFSFIRNNVSRSMMSRGGLL